MKRVAINEWAEPKALLPRLRNPEIQDCDELDLNRNLLGPEGMRALAKLHFPRLVTLELFANRIGDQGAQFLSEASFARRLTRLGLGGEYRYGLDNNIGDEGFVVLLPKLEAIKDLQLAYNRAGSIAASALDACRSLHRLDLQANRLGNAGARALAETNLHLGRLDLSKNRITDEGIAALAGTSFLHSLEFLSLDENGIGDGGARSLAYSDFRPRQLDLNGCGISDAGVEALAASPILTRVESLGLGDNRIGEAGLAMLIQSPFLSNLKSLCFRNNPAGPQYTPWTDWDGGVVGNDFDNAHAERIAARFPRLISVS